MLRRCILKCIFPLELFLSTGRIDQEGEKPSCKTEKRYFLSKYMHRNCVWGRWAQMLWVFVNVLTRPLALSYRAARKILFSESQGSSSLCNVNWNGGDEYVSSLAIWNKDKQLFSWILGCAELTCEQRKLAQDILTMSHKRKKEQKERLEFEFASVESKEY